MMVRSALLRTVLLLGVSLFGAAVAFGQAQPTQQQPTQQQPPATQAPDNKQAAPLTLEGAPPPVNAEEEAAFKVFQDAKNDEPEKKAQAAEDFEQKYPQSRHLSEVYGWLVKWYYSKGQTDKMEAVGDKQLQIAPNDPMTLAIVGSTLPRAMNASTPEPQKRLAKAEQYCQKALDVLPTLTKPEGMADDVFLQAKNQAAAFAYSGLGVVDFRRGKFADAIPNLEQSVKLDAQPDPVNYYILGICNEKTSHFDEAVSAFTKCSAIPSGMQAMCKQNIEEAKKLGATQLSAPK